MKKEELYNKIDPLLNGIIGRLTFLKTKSIPAKEAHAMALEIAAELDDWIKDE